MSTFKNLAEDNSTPIKAWVEGVEVEDMALKQLRNTASLPFIFKHLAVMPDVHFGLGATIGSVIATKGAIIPAAVGCDLGCGLLAVQTSLTASDLPDTLSHVRGKIEASVPHGRTNDGGRGDQGAWGEIPVDVEKSWSGLINRFKAITDKHPKVTNSNNVGHLGTLGTGNHFIEICLDEADRVWVMLHSGSRGVGGRIGNYFIELAKQDMKRWFINLPDVNLAYLPEGTDHFKDYCEAVEWAQDFALANRNVMVSRTLKAMATVLPPFTTEAVVVSCHHNYISKEFHFGENVFVTRKGAVRAREGDLGLIPGSMGTRSYVVRGKGNRDSFCSCSHGAGRRMSRTEAKKRFTVEDQIKATEGVECRKDEAVIDEIPMAYKSIDAVMAAQSDLVEIVHTLKGVLCVKG